MNRAMMAISKHGATVWRNNTGMGWAGKSIALAPGETYRAKGGERLVFAARPLKAGLCEGSADLIGFKTVTITPDMVGKKVAVFHAWEVKDGNGRLSPAQKHFLDHINCGGGFAVEIRSVAQAEQAIIRV